MTCTIHSYLLKKIGPPSCMTDMRAFLFIGHAPFLRTSTLSQCSLQITAARLALPSSLILPHEDLPASSAGAWALFSSPPISMLWGSQFGHYDRQNSMLQRRCHVIQVRILWQLEIAHERTTATFCPVPGIRLLHFLLDALTADTERPPLDNHMNLLLLQLRHVRLEDVLPLGLLPVHTDARYNMHVSSKHIDRAGVTKEDPHGFDGVRKLVQSGPAIDVCWYNRHCL